MKRIGYVGPFCDSNFGDINMAINDILDIGYKDIAVFTMNPKSFAEASQRYLQDFKVDIIEIHLSERLVKSIERNEQPSTPLELLNYIENRKEIQEHIEALDKLVVTGGGFLNDLWFSPHRIGRLSSILAPVILASNIGIKVVFMANTFGPFENSKLLFSSIFTEINHSASLATRDNYLSRPNLRMLGIEQPCKYLPDDLYFPNPRMLVGKSTICENIPEEPYFVLELHSHTDELISKMNYIVSFVSALQTEHGLRCVFLPLDKGFGGESQADILKASIPEIEVVKNKEAFLPFEKALSIVKNASFVLCQRYHLFLIAVANNIPTVQILRKVCNSYSYYYTKGIGLLESVFHTQNWEASQFMYLNLETALSTIPRELGSIKSKHKSLYNQKKENCESTMRNLRIEYIEQMFPQNQ